MITDFKAYLDISLECENPRSMLLHSELQSSGVTLVHCPHNGKKDVVDKMMIVDILAFALVKPCPTTIVMITGDRDFSYAAAILKQRGHKVIVIVPPYKGQSILRMQADHSYDWRKDVVGETSAEAVAVDVVDLVLEPRQAPPKEQYEPEEFNPRNGYEPPRTTAEPTVSSRLNVNAKPTFLGKLIGGSDRSCIRSKSLESSQDGVKGTCCARSICLRPPEITTDQKVDFTNPIGKQLDPPDEGTSEQISPAETQFAEEASMSTSTPSSILSGNSSSDSMVSSVPSMNLKNQDSRNVFSDWSYVVEISRFGTLLEVLLEHHALTGATSIHSDIVASEMLKRDPNVYKNAGVTRMKQYIEEARKVEVVIASEPEHGGSSLIELNPKLYAEFSRCGRMGKADMAAGLSVPSGRSPIVENVFMPLVERLRSAKPSYRLSSSTLGTFFKTAHPGIYERADVSGLYEYIKKAEERGIVQSRAGESTRWIDLMPTCY